MTAAWILYSLQLYGALCLVREGLRLRFEDINSILDGGHDADTRPL